MILPLEYFQNMMYLFDKFYEKNKYEFVHGPQNINHKYCHLYKDFYGKIIYDKLKTKFTNLLYDLNLEARIFDDKEEVIITEKSAAVTAILPLVEEEFRRPIIEYNAKRLKGDLEKKKIILRKLGEKLEKRRKDFQNKHKEFNNKFKNKLDELLSDETLKKIKINLKINYSV